MQRNTPIDGIIEQHASTCKGKAHSVTVHEGPEVEQRYSSTLSLTFFSFCDRARVLYILKTNFLH